MGTDGTGGRRGDPAGQTPRVPRVPWDVAVILVDGTGLRGAGSAATGSRAIGPVESRVDLGMDLPGVGGVTATTVELDGRTLLAAIRPQAEAGWHDGPRPEPLAHLLARLAEQDGRVPVLVEGTPFTRAVLTALSEVPPGERVSYAELAARAGRPRAVRAAAHVMATNRVPLVLPCHRVVPSGGGTGRYGWGDAVKPVLLAGCADVTCPASLR